MDLAALKKELLHDARSRTRARLSNIRLPNNQRAHVSVLNTAARGACAEIRARILQEPDLRRRQDALMTARYVEAVLLIELRQRAWAYDYMSLSRRAGELWHEFAAAAWEAPARSDHRRRAAPAFARTLQDVRTQLAGALPGDIIGRQALESVDSLIRLAGNVNLKTDQVFEIGGRLHAADLKGGFGSNEKGNTERLERVAQAYRMVDSECCLSLLIRDTEGNGYLDRLRRGGLWAVAQGEDAYAAIDEFTGSRCLELRRHVTHFEADLAPDIWRALASSPGDLTSYLSW